MMIVHDPERGSGRRAHRWSWLTSVAPAARAVAMAWATIRPAPLPEPVLPARSRIPAITAHSRVLIVVASGESPLPSTCLPAILVWP